MAVDEARIRSAMNKLTEARSQMATFERHTPQDIIPFRGIYIHPGTPEHAAITALVATKLAGDVERAQQTFEEACKPIEEAEAQS